MTIFVGPWDIVPDEVYIYSEDGYRLEGKIDHVQWPVYDNEEVIGLDGGFTVEDLESIAAWVRAHRTVT